MSNSLKSTKNDKNLRHKQHKISERDISDPGREFYNATMKGEGKMDVSKSVFMKYYKPLDDWWNYYPKTDYTYSPLSKMRYELEPGMTAMPNMSRSPIGSNRRLNYSSCSYSDSDNEEYSRVSRRETRLSITRRITTIIRYIATFISTVIVTLYSYTIGALVYRAEIEETAEQYNAPLLLRPFLWLLNVARQFSKYEAMLASGFVSKYRNLLLLLLLLLFFGVPLYFLFIGGYDFTARNSNFTEVYEKFREGLFSMSAYFRGMKDTYTASLPSIGWNISRETPFLESFSLGWLFNGIGQLFYTAWDSAYAIAAWICYSGLGLFNLLMSLLSYLLHLFQICGSWIIMPPFWLFATLNKTFTEYQVAPEQVILKPQVQTSFSSEGATAAINSDVNVELLASKVLGSAAFQQWQAGQSVEMVIMKLTDEIEKLKLQIVNDGNKNSMYMKNAAEKISVLENDVLKLQSLLIESKICCENLENKIGILAADMENKVSAEVSDEIVANIKSKLELDKAHGEILKLAADLVLLNEKLASLSTAGSVSGSLNVQDKNVYQIVAAALAKYDADKTALVDYALESGGGTILSTRCTEDYGYRNAETYFFGLGWLSKEYRPNTPRSIIQPNMNPGECWAFKGATGYVVINLSATIHITSVTMEHIPRSISPNNKITSAPKDFLVWGIQSLTDKEPLLLGKFRYEDNDNPLQSFAVKDHTAVPFKLIELHIESNHGHIEYTCVYRFRVHGDPA